MFGSRLIIVISTIGLFSISCNRSPDNRIASYSHDRWGTLPQDTMRFFEAFIVSFDGADDNDRDGTRDKWGIPEWVAYEVMREQEQNGKMPARPQWETDQVLYEAGLAPSDESYAFSVPKRKADPDNPIFHYQRGHMCRNSTAFRLGIDAADSTFTLLNACPQLDKLNQGIWKTLENDVESWADEFDSVWVICGPVIYDLKPKAWLGETTEFKVAIPDAFYKIVIRPGDKPDQPIVLGFIIPQLASPEKNHNKESYIKYAVSIDSIEQITGLDFLTVLPDEIEREIESKKSPERWTSQYALKGR